MICIKTNFSKKSDFLALYNFLSINRKFLFFNSVFNSLSRSIKNAKNYPSLHKLEELGLKEVYPGEEEK